MDDECCHCVVCCFTCVLLPFSNIQISECTYSYSNCVSPIDSNIEYIRLCYSVIEIINDDGIRLNCHLKNWHTAFFEKLIDASSMLRAEWVSVEITARAQSIYWWVFWHQHFEGSWGSYSWLPRWPSIHRWRTGSTEITMASGKMNGIIMNMSAGCR